MMKIVSDNSPVHFLLHHQLGFGLSTGGRKPFLKRQEYLIHCSDNQNTNITPTPQASRSSKLLQSYHGDYSSFSVPAEADRAKGGAPIQLDSNSSSSRCQNHWRYRCRTDGFGNCPCCGAKSWSSSYHHRFVSGFN